jgi:hypothetical protein
MPVFGLEKQFGQTGDSGLFFFGVKFNLQSKAKQGIANYIYILIFLFERSEAEDGNCEANELGQKRNQMMIKGYLLYANQIFSMPAAIDHFVSLRQCISTLTVAHLLQVSH